MYSHAPDNYVCPICQIIRGETTEKGSAEADVLFRDDKQTVFLVGKWIQSNPGHIIIVPNDHTENIYTLPDELGHRISDMTKKVALILKEAYGCDGTSIGQHNEPAGNQDAFHYHLHVFPRYDGDEYYTGANDNKFWPTLEEKKPYAEKLKPYFK